MMTRQSRAWQQSVEHCSTGAEDSPLVDGGGLEREAMSWRVAMDINSGHEMKRI